MARWSYGLEPIQLQYKSCCAATEPPGLLDLCMEWALHIEDDDPMYKRVPINIKRHAIEQRNLFRALKHVPGLTPRLFVRCSEEECTLLYALSLPFINLELANVHTAEQQQVVGLDTLDRLLINPHDLALIELVLQELKAEECTHIRQRMIRAGLRMWSLPTVKHLLNTIVETEDVIWVGLIQVVGWISQGVWDNPCDEVFWFMHSRLPLDNFETLKAIVNRGMVSRLEKFLEVSELCHTEIVSGLCCCDTYGSTGIVEVIVDKFWQIDAGALDTSYRMRVFHWLCRSTDESVIHTAIRRGWASGVRRYQYARIFGEACVASNCTRPPWSSALLGVSGEKAVPHRPDCAHNCTSGESLNQFVSRPDNLQQLISCIAVSKHPHWIRTAAESALCASPILEEHFKHLFNLVHGSCAANNCELNCGSYDMLSSVDSAFASNSSVQLAKYLLDSYPCIFHKVKHWGHIAMHNAELATSKLCHDIGHLDFESPHPSRILCRPSHFH